MNYPEARKEYKHSSHLVYSCQYHIVFCPKYRRKVLTEEIAKRAKELFTQIAEENDFDILDMEIMPDHVHILVDCSPKFGVEHVVKLLKGKSSRILRDEFPELDMDKVIRMCLIHDLGEAFTGDIPAFDKKEEDSQKEDEVFFNWVSTFPEPYREEFSDLLTEMIELKTGEAKLYKALDNLEAVIQHNEADISTWIPLEYDLQFTYGADKVKFSPYLKELKQ